MTFNKQTAREICEAEAESDPDTSDWCNYHCKMGDLLPDALDRIEELEAILIEERARRICHMPTDTVGHWPRYEQVVVDEAKLQLYMERKICVSAR